MDAAEKLDAIRAIDATRAKVLQMLLDLPAAGLVGLEAMSQCAKVMNWVEGLRVDNASDALAQLQALSRDLKAIDTAFERGAHPESFRVALTKLVTVAETMRSDLDGLLSKKK